MSMTAMRTSETAGWVPEFVFEVWSLGIDCRKFQADCCRNLAKAAAEKEAQALHSLAERQEKEIKNLSGRINSVLDNLLGRFYANGGQAMSGSLQKETKDQIRVYLDEMEAYEQVAGRLVGNGECGSALKFAEKQERYYQQMFRQLADLYPEGEIKEALLELAA